MGLLLLGCGAPRDTATLPPAHPPNDASAVSGTVVFVLTTAGEQHLANGKTRQTGFFLGEFFDAYQAVTEAGYDAVLATPDGRPPIVDPESLKADYWQAHPDRRDAAIQFVEHDPRMLTPMPLANARARARDFDGVVVPGGQGVMIDLIDDADLQALVTMHGASGRAVGLICHAPALLSRLSADDNPFAGRIVTSVSGAEELYIETFVMHGRAQQRRIARQLGKNGLRHRARFPGKAFAVRDGNLVTSQNPFSGDAFGQHYVAALEQHASR